MAATYAFVSMFLFALYVNGACSSLVPGLFVFGDSTVDTGNLGYRPNTVQIIRTQELPYGRDFVPPGPTGRASNGKLPTDFLAENLGLPTPIDYLEPDAHGSKLVQGINFAAGGSGILNGTGFTTITMSQQLDAFERSRHKMNQALGIEKTSELLGRSLFLISTGNNDLFNYVYNLKARFDYTPQDYNQLLLSTLSRDIQRMYTLGGRRFIVLSVGPLGCVPFMLNLLESDGGCITEINDQVKSMNSGLRSLTIKLQASLSGSQLIYANAFDILYGAIQNPTKYGFKSGNVACCGSGRYHGSILEPCNKQSEVCSVASENVFWDLVHPTQAMYKLVTDDLFKQLVKFL